MSARLRCKHCKRHIETIRTFTGCCGAKDIEEYYPKEVIDEDPSIPYGFVLEQGYALCKRCGTSVQFGKTKSHYEQYHALGVNMGGMEGMEGYD